MNESLQVLSSLILTWSLMLLPAESQIIRDATLPDASVVTSDGNRSVITGGTQAGSNLFHSFQTFSVPADRTASFQQINPEIRNVITRVTGSSISQIQGAIEALQANGTLSLANFFLINPNGITFGRNASLNIGGSFLATTGDRLTFANGFQFRADGTQSSALLTVSVPVGLQFGQTPGAIRSQSRSNAVLGADDQFTGGLQVRAGQTIALIGGAIDLAGGLLTAPEGRIELGSVAAGSVRLIPTAGGWTLDYRNVQDFRDLSFSGRLAALNVNGSRGGSIQLQGRNLSLSGETFITSYTQADQPGGKIHIRADQLSLSNFSGILTFTSGIGKSGDISLEVNELTLQGGSQIATITGGAGRGGNITIANADRVSLSGRGSLAAVPTGILLQATPEAAAGARAGNLTLQTQVLQLRDGAQISTTTFGSAAGGTMQIQATAVDLAGVLLDPVRGKPIVDRTGQTYPTGLFADTDIQTSGAGGDLVLQSDRLTVRDGAVIQTNTEGSGDTGTLTIRASEFVEVRGSAGAGLPPSTLFSASGGIPGIAGGSAPSATGRGGLLSIRTGELRVLDGGTIAVGSSNPNGTRGAGSLDIQSQRILLDRGQLLSNTASGTGGNLNLQAANLLLLNRNSQISTEVGDFNADMGLSGNGGNIAIRAGFVVAPPLANSDILTRAIAGQGGNITITTQGILGLEQRPATPNNGTNDLDLRARSGNSGSFTLNPIATDPSRSLTALPTNAIDASSQISQSCSVQVAAQGNFVVTGRGGLPADPANSRSRPVLTDWATLRPGDRAISPPASSPINQSISQSISQSNLPAGSSLSSTAVTEAQSWIVADGRVTLIAEASMTAPDPARLEPSQCDRPL